MPRITFNAFSELQRRLKEKHLPYANVAIEAPDGALVSTLLSIAGLEQSEVEAVFVNGVIRPFSHVLRSGDRVAALPRGTPGPYRVLLGLASPTSDENKSA